MNNNKFSDEKSSTENTKKEKKSINVLFGQRLAEIRKARKFKQEEFSDMLGVHKQTTSRYERGEISPSLEILEKMSKIFNVQIDYFISETENDLIKIPIINSTEPYILNKSLLQKLKNQSNLQAYICENNNMSPVIQKDDIVICSMNNDSQVSLDQLVLVVQNNYAIKRVSKIADDEVELTSTDANIKPMTCLINDIVPIEAYFRSNI